jgi:hypothetical protein
MVTAEFAAGGDQHHVHAVDTILMYRRDIVSE